MTDETDRALNQMMVVAQILTERHAQDEKWGEQNHPDLSPLISPPNRPEMMDRANYRRIELVKVARYYGIPTAAEARVECNNEHKQGNGSWFSIHVEELGEALEAAVLGDTVALRTELVQLAATVTAHIEAIDRRN